MLKMNKRTILILAIAGVVISSNAQSPPSPIPTVQAQNEQNRVRQNGNGMVKRNKKRQSRSKSQQEAITPGGKWKSLLRKLSSPTGIVLTSISFLIAVVCAYFQFKAKVSVEPETPLLKSDSLIDTPFRIANQGVLPIYNIKHAWYVEKERGTEGWAKGMVSVEKIERDAETNDTIPKLSGLDSVTVSTVSELKK